MKTGPERRLQLPPLADRRKRQDPLSWNQVILALRPSPGNDHLLEAMFAAEPALTLSNFKSFGPAGARLDRIARVNIVIGKNNSGKSAILDAIDLLCRGEAASRVHYRHGERPQMRLSQRVGQTVAQQAFPAGNSGAFVSGSWDQVASLFAKSVVEANFDGKSVSEAQFRLDEGFNRLTDYYRSGLTRDNQQFKARVQDAQNRIGNPLKGLRVVRVAAERNLQPEPERADKSFSASGAGLVGLLAYLITSSNERSAIVEEEFRTELNAVLEPDIRISAIRTYKQENGSWEIYFAGDKGPIAMSESGSGLKTVVQTLASLWLMPRLGVYRNEECIFLLEELENNLHPALQRRLLSYIWNQIEGRSCAFLATHSSVAIDMFNRNPDAQIVHVTQNGGEARASTAHTTVSHGGIIDDLDVRASDILQSNCIVWVEGPSDRIYFNRWISLVSNDELVEGVHYQCLFYGGRLLSHLNADYGEEDAAESICILRANRHAILLMDSDRSTSGGKINSTKTRVKQEIEAIGGYAWISDGREIENDIAAQAFGRLDPRLSIGLKSFDEVEKVIEAQMGTAGKRLAQSKAVLASRLAPLIERDDIGPKLLGHLEECVARIRRWNGSS